MGWATYIPSNLEEFHDKFQLLFENRSHVNTVKVDTAMKQLKVDLDWAANLKVPDFYVPLKNSRVTEAKETAYRMWNKMQQGIAPGKEDVQALYDMIDMSPR